MLYNSKLSYLFQNQDNFDRHVSCNRLYFKLIDPNLFCSFQPCFFLTTNVFKGYGYSSFLNQYWKRSNNKIGIKNFFLTFKNFFFYFLNQRRVPKVFRAYKFSFDLVLYNSRVLSHRSINTRFSSENETCNI